MRRIFQRFSYNADGLKSIHCSDYLQDASFIKAYQRGVKAIGGTDEYRWHWRVHVGLWAAYSASTLDGDFVECGVNKGFLSSAIMEYLDWDSLDKTFYLLDTFTGLDDRFVTAEEAKGGAMKKSNKWISRGFYTSDVESVKENFSQWKNVRIIQGAIPETLPNVDSTKLAYLHLDMNCSPPEVAAANWFWDRLVPGAFILMDDYAYCGYHTQKTGMDKFATQKGVRICSLPTGQGLLMKPPG
jgi:hypothetical protein